MRRPASLRARSKQPLPSSCVRSREFHPDNSLWLRPVRAASPVSEVRFSRARTPERGCLMTVANHLEPGRRGLLKRTAAGIAGLFGLTLVAKPADAATSAPHG